MLGFEMEVAAVWQIGPRGMRRISDALPFSSNEQQQEVIQTENSRRCYISFSKHK